MQLSVLNAVFAGLVSVFIRLSWLIDVLDSKPLHSNSGFLQGRIGEGGGGGEMVKNSTLLLSFCKHLCLKNRGTVDTIEYKFRSQSLRF